MAVVLGITSAPQCCFCWSRGRCPPAGSQRSSPESSRSKHGPINRAGRQQNDRHPYYKPQTPCSRGPSVLSRKHGLLTPTTQCRSLWVRLAQGAPGAIRPICRLRLAKPAIRRFLSLHGFGPWGRHLSLVCCYWQREGRALRDVYCWCTTCTLEGCLQGCHQGCHQCIASTRWTYYFHSGF